jgi:uncharacterized protein
MRRALIRCRGCLGDFLPPGRRNRHFAVDFELPTGLRDLVQSTGVPHVEVARVLVDGEPAGWEQVVHGGESIEVHPRYPLDRTPGEARFVLDVHLGRLARNLRLLGIDAIHDPAADDPRLVAVSRGEGRTLLTRDRGLLMRSGLADGTFVRETEPVGQTVEVVRRFRLSGSIRPFTRCLVCNGLLVEADAGHPDIPPAVRSEHEHFRRCPGCGRLYWEGSHVEGLRGLVTEIETRAADAG